MECISELKDSLNAYFGWNKARMACFVNMLIALLATRTVNLSKLACVVFGEAQQSSRYRRIQRFFSKFPLDYQQIAGFIFKLFLVSGGQWYLSIDRTHWRWGKSDINILMLGIVFKGTAIPIYWMLLDKRGHSDTRERMALIQMFIEHFGKDWFGWLLKEKIPFHIRIKNNTITTNTKGLQVDIDALFYGLKPNEQRSLKGQRIVWGHFVYLAGLRWVDGELLKEGMPEGFTKRYNVHRLVYYEIHSDVYEAITREKRIKKWNRQWKINLIEQTNSQWLDLSIGLF